MLRSRGVVVALSVLSLCAFGAGCGGDDGATEEQLQQAREEAIQEVEAEAKLEQLEDQVKQLQKKQGEQKSNRSSSGTDQAGKGDDIDDSDPTLYAEGPQTDCTDGVQAGANTSCEFAMNVAGEYGSNPGASSIRAFSPATGEFYSLRCSPWSGGGTVCAGGNGASVFIP